MRTEFSLNNTDITRARLYICGLGYYIARINGQRVGDHVLGPTTQFQIRVMYPEIPHYKGKVCLKQLWPRKRSDVTLLALRSFFFSEVALHALLLHRDTRQIPRL